MEQSHKSNPSHIRWHSLQSH